MFTCSAFADYSRWGDFITTLKNPDGNEFTVMYSCWTEKEATIAADTFMKTVHRPVKIAAIEHYINIADARCLKMRPNAFGWAISFSGTPDDPDWTMAQLRGLDSWILSELVNNPDYDSPRGSLSEHPEVKRRLIIEQAERDEEMAREAEKFHREYFPEDFE